MPIFTALAQHSSSSFDHCEINRKVPLASCDLRIPVVPSIVFQSRVLERKRENTPISEINIQDAVT